VQAKKCRRNGLRRGFLACALGKFDGGGIKIGGQTIPKINGKGATMLRHNKINYLFQSYALINDMTIMQNLLVVMKFMNILKKEKIQRADKVLNLNLINI